MTDWFLLAKWICVPDRRIEKDHPALGRRMKMDFSEAEKTEEERKYPRFYIMRLEELVKTQQQRINQLEALCRKLAEALRINFEFTKYAAACQKHNTKEYIEDFFRLGEQAQDASKLVLSDAKKAGIISGLHTARGGQDTDGGTEAPVVPVESEVERDG